MKRISCPACTTKFKVKDHRVPLHKGCPNCGSILVVKKEAHTEGLTVSLAGTVVKQGR